MATPTSVLARDFMTEKLVTLTADMDALDAIRLLLQHSISGAPVVGEHRSYLGVFSEKSCMQLLIDAAYEQMPSSLVGHFMNTDRGRTISPETTFLSVVQLFLTTNYRRLPVLGRRRAGRADQSPRRAAAGDGYAGGRTRQGSVAPVPERAARARRRSHVAASVAPPADAALGAPRPTSKRGCGSANRSPHGLWAPNRSTIPPVTLPLWQTVVHDGGRFYLLGGNLDFDHLQTLSMCDRRHALPERSRR